MSDNPSKQVNFNFVRESATRLLGEELQLEGFHDRLITIAQDVLSELISKDVTSESLDFDAMALKLLPLLTEDSSE
jgi:hypothetical protein